MFPGSAPTGALSFLTPGMGGRLWRRAESLPVAQRFAPTLQLASYLLHHGIVSVVSSFSGRIRSHTGHLQT